MKIKVRGEKIKFTNMTMETVTTNSINYFKCDFEFDEAWDTFTKTAVFYIKEDKYPMVIENNQCLIPSELLQDGVVTLFIGLLGTRLEPYAQLTTNWLSKDLTDGTTRADDFIVPPTPDIYTQLLDIVNKKNEESIAAAELSTTKAQEALTSAKNAKTSEDNSKTSELNSKESEINAKNSEELSLQYEKSSQNNADLTTANLELTTQNKILSEQYRTQAEASKNAAKISEDNAKSSENNAKNSEQKAALSEEEATNAMDKAIQWAISDELIQDGMVNDYSSKYYANKSKISSDNAKISEDNAKISEDNAKTSEDNALIYKNNTIEEYIKVKQQADNAEVSAFNARSSENNVSAIEDNIELIQNDVTQKSNNVAQNTETVLAAKEAVSISEGNAKQSEINAKTSENNAKTSKEAANFAQEQSELASQSATQNSLSAMESARGALKSAQDAEASAQVALTKATEASVSAESASQSAQALSNVYTRNQSDNRFCNAYFQELQPQTTQTIIDANASDLVSLKVFGLCTENGIPSPTNTVELTSLSEDAFSIKANNVDVNVSKNKALYSVGNIADEQDIVSGVTTQRLAKESYTGNENWALHTTTTAINTEGETVTAYVYRLFDPKYGIASRTNQFALSNNFQSPVNGIYSTDRRDIPLNSILGLGSGSGGFLFIVTSFSTVDSFKAFLAEKYNSNSPVEAIYTLANPKIITDTGIKIAMLNGANSLVGTRNFSVLYNRNIYSVIEELKNAIASLVSGI